jgi:hypothetical protein
MNNLSSRMQHERKTIDIMISMYCHDIHGKNELCPQCRNLRDYAQKKLEKCPFQEGKTTCAKCPVHCYQPEMRVLIRSVMRHSGPRMIYKHPVLAIRHLIDSRRKKPVKKKVF